MSHTYEVEIKSLLGTQANADSFMTKLKKFDPEIKLSSEGKQLNHYFNVAPKGVDLSNVLSDLIPTEKKTSLQQILKEGKGLSIRTRESGDKVLFVIKASVGSDSSSNGVKRIEFESPVQISLAELDKRLIDAGLSYQAKWSRERKEYISKDIHICLDKNAGYGYLAEFEKMTENESELEKTRQELLVFMTSMGAIELSQERIERMFAHYNANWQDYYGTEKVFNIE